MIFTSTSLTGVYLVDIERHEDERGYFARAWCRREFADHNLDPDLVQCNLSYNRNLGTVRGMHLQLPPHTEAKLVRCIQGGVYFILVDLRPNSTTYLKWAGFELNAQNKSALYIPKGYANGFQTLMDDSEIFYQMSAYFAPDHAVGYRWNDAAFQIKWPAPITTISTRDQMYPDYIIGSHPELNQFL